MAEEQQGNIVPHMNLGRLGMDMDNTDNQVKSGVVTYALNAAVENFDSSSVNYQNEPGNEFCFEFPEGFQLIGTHFIQEQNKHVFFITNPDTGDSEIGYMDNNDCVYRTYISAKCLNFNIDHPIHKSVHKITNCTTQVYWTDGLNPRRFIDLENAPWINKPGTNVCDNELVPGIVDCNKLLVQPNFDIPQLDIVEVRNGGDLKAGTYQFAIQYCDANGNGYTSFYSVTNPTPIANTQITTLNFDYQVGKSIVLDVANIDITGYYQYFNIAVIKTVNAIASAEIVGTYFIDDSRAQIIYTGQNVANIRIAVEEIIQKFPYYNVAQDVTSVRDILVWDNLTSDERINYQRIANQISLQWETWRLPANEDYSDEINATDFRGYLRDEVYAFEIVFLLKNGQQTDGFHIPGRAKNANDAYPDVPETNNDFIGKPEYISSGVGYTSYWKVYNTAYKLGDSPGKNVADPNYRGPWEYGGFAYWESTDVYPCNELVWGELANQPIRHHKFPDLRISPIHENPTILYQGGKIAPVIVNDAIYPIGVKVSIRQIKYLISTSSLTQEQKDNIVGFKIVRGDRATNKSIVAKGILRNVGKYERQKTSYYYPNYPYNDLREDPFLLTKSNAYTLEAGLSAQSQITCRSFTITAGSDSVIEYTDCYTNEVGTIFVQAFGKQDICALDYPKPKILSGVAFITCNTYARYKITARGAYFRFTPPKPFGNTVFTGGRPFPTFGWPIPNGPAPFGYPTWEDYCLVNPSDQACRLCLDENISTFPNGYYMSKFNSTGQDLGYIYYIDSLNVPYYQSGDTNYTIEQLATYGYTTCAPGILQGFTYPEAAYRMVFNSPETSFGQPFLGNILKLETVMFGAGKAHFVQVKKNAMYKLLTKEAQIDALNSSYDIAAVGGFDATAMFTAYQAYLQIYINGITRQNYGYSFNSIASYDYWGAIDNNQAIGTDVGIKQRELEIYQYLIPGVQNVGDDFNINNYQRESSVYLKTVVTKTALPFPDTTPSIAPGGTSLISDDTRFTIGPNTLTRGTDCTNPEKLIDTKVVAYYGSIKNEFVNQWGQIYTYDTIDTGFQVDLNTATSTEATVFGGDTFISRFAFKTKLPFFIDNRVNAPDDSDIFYDEIGNVAYPRYWHSARSVLADFNRGANMRNIISFKAHNFDCPNKQEPQSSPGRTYYGGKMYMFAYGIPNFYCESSINTDLRQAFNDREGDFWPHVSTSIPDDWVQESFVPIAQDNTYYYNVTFSKQNKENYFSHLPVDWDGDQCFTYYPFRAIYSDAQQDFTDNSVNSWLIYRPVSYFDFPQNYGPLTSLDGIQNKAVLARFHNKTLMYNSLLTIDTSNPKAAYIGNDKLFAAAPPIDFAETDLGYVGSQHKMLLKIPQGQVTIDAKRGNVFLITGDGAKDLAAFGSGMNRFFTDHLAFEILRYFPKVNIDNHFKNLGLHGVYDSKYDRIIITKLDYIPLQENIIYDETDQEFYLVELINGVQVKTQIYVTDEEYFCNKSWSVSFNFNTNSWVSFHSYLPNWYIGENNFFYSGLNGGCYIDTFVGEILPPKPTTTSSSTTMDPCSCIRFINTSASPINVEYVDCDGNPSGLTPVPALDFLDVCGKDPNDFGNPNMFYTVGGPCTYLNPFNSQWYCYSSTTKSGEFVISPCALIVFAVNITPIIEPTTTSSTSSTSSTTSTTSTTTTICINCSTYRITNNDNCDATIVVDTCFEQDQSFTLIPFGSIIICACPTPTFINPNIIVTLLVADQCETCFCYTLTNISSTNQQILWGSNCESSDVGTNNNFLSETLSPGQSKCVCTAYNSIFVDLNSVLIEGGSVPCIGGSTICGECTDVCSPGLIVEEFMGDCTCRTYTYSIASLPSGAESIRWVLTAPGSIVSKTNTSITVKFSDDYVFGAVIAYPVTPCGTLGESSIYHINLPICTTTTTTCYPDEVYLLNNVTGVGAGQDGLIQDIFYNGGLDLPSWTTQTGGSGIPLSYAEDYIGTHGAIPSSVMDFKLLADSKMMTFGHAYLNCEEIGCFIVPSGTGSSTYSIPAFPMADDDKFTFLLNSEICCTSDSLLVINNTEVTNILKLRYNNLTFYTVTAGTDIPIPPGSYLTGSFNYQLTGGNLSMTVGNGSSFGPVYVRLYVNCQLLYCIEVDAGIESDINFGYMNFNLTDKIAIVVDLNPCATPLPPLAPSSSVTPDPVVPPPPPSSTTTTTTTTSVPTTTTTTTI